MQYALSVIILHRPFCAKHYIQPQPLVGAGPNHAREMCIRSAIDLTRLVTRYQQLYTLRRANVQIIHATFTAALVLVYGIISDVAAQFDVDLSAHLDACCQALVEMGEVFRNAARVLDILFAIKRSWQARMISTFGGKKRAGSGGMT